MVQSLKLGTGPEGAEPNILRVNRRYVNKFCDFL